MTKIINRELYAEVSQWVLRLKQSLSKKVCCPVGSWRFENDQFGLKGICDKLEVRGDRTRIMNAIKAS